MSTPKGLLFDLHGVLQHFDNHGARAGEEAAGLPLGTIDRVAYQHPAYEAAKVGLMTDDEWAWTIAHHLVEQFGECARAAIDPWRSDRGRPDPVMIDLVKQAAQVTVVGVLSNFTDRMHTDLALHGITAHHAFASADLGVTKPSPLAFREATTRMGIRPHDLYYFDNEVTFVTGARAAGLRAELFTTPQACARRLGTLGIPVQLPDAGA
ncbi:HAD family hydrolase [Kitasatospora sp. NPDC056181]|uniref:HAD family hydrolase n=1 Tax=Kitasatospora sp. NPDC056181 TaxID=3345737 RepID=UPI0035DC7DC9